MTTGNTTLLGLALPVTGELSGSWGDTVNNSITSLLDSAIAGTTTLSTDADVTLTTTALAANQARQAILNCTGTRTAQRTLTAPAASKTYIVINATTGGFAVKLVGAGPTTGVTVAAGEVAIVAWNGTDFVKAINGGPLSGTTLSLSGQLTSTVSTGIAPLAIASTTKVTNLNADLLDGGDWAAPGAIGSTTPSTGAFTTLSARGNIIAGNGSAGTNNLTAQTLDGGGNNMILQASGTAGTVGTLNGYPVNVIVANSTIGTFSSTGLAVTGALSATGNVTLGDASTDTLNVGNGGLIKDASGNVGIGVTPTNGKLQVHSGTGDGATYDTVFALSRTSSTGNVLSAKWVLDDKGTNYGNLVARIKTTPSGSESGAYYTDALTLDGQSGNLGLGVTPAAATRTTLQIGAYGTIDNNGGTGIEVNSNAVYNSGWKYIATAAASQYYQFAGAHVWQTAPSGTAGNSISFSQAMTLDASGNLGLGVTPSAWSGSAKAIQIPYGALWNVTDAVYLGANYYLNSSSQRIYLNTGKYALEYLQYTADGSHRWYTAPSGTAGNVATLVQCLAVGNGTTLALEGATSAAGTGIAFPATQLASSNANTLDDYEEGTFTPTIVGTTTAGAGTYTAQTGTYTKIGNVVHFYAFCVWTAHTGTGNIRVSSLPFTAGATSPVLSTYVRDLTYTGTHIQSFVAPTTTSVNVEQTSSGSASSGVPMDTAAAIAVSGFYYV